MTPVDVALILGIKTKWLDLFKGWCFWLERIEDVKAFSELCDPRYRRWLEVEQHYGLDWTVKWQEGRGDSK